MTLLSFPNSVKISEKYVVMCQAEEMRNIVVVL